MSNLGGGWLINDRVVELNGEPGPAQEFKSGQVAAMRRVREEVAGRTGNGEYRQERPCCGSIHARRGETPGW